MKFKVFKINISLIILACLFSCSNNEDKNENENKIVSDSLFYSNALAQNTEILDKYECSLLTPNQLTVTKDQKQILEVNFNSERRLQTISSYEMDNEGVIIGVNFSDERTPLVLNVITNDTTYSLNILNPGGGCGRPYTNFAILKLSLSGNILWKNYTNSINSKSDLYMDEKAQKRLGLKNSQEWNSEITDITSNNGVIYVAGNVQCNTLLNDSALFVKDTTSHNFYTGTEADLYDKWPYYSFISTIDKAGKLTTEFFLNEGISWYGRGTSNMAKELRIKKLYIKKNKLFIVGNSSKNLKYKNKLFQGEGYQNFEVPCSYSDFIAVYDISSSGALSFSKIITATSDKRDNAKSSFIKFKNIEFLEDKIFVHGSYYCNNNLNFQGNALNKTNTGEFGASREFFSFIDYDSKIICFSNLNFLPEEIFVLSAAPNNKNNDVTSVLGAFGLVKKFDDISVFVNKYPINLPSYRFNPKCYISKIDVAKDSISWLRLIDPKVEKHNSDREEYIDFISQNIGYIYFNSSYKTPMIYSPNNRLNAMLDTNTAFYGDNLILKLLPKN